ncbi:MAG: hypothetical protein ACJ790_06280, partial [Myxococcaceae bacterium]
MRRTLIIGVLSAALSAAIGCTGRADKVQPTDDPAAPSANPSQNPTDSAQPYDPVTGTGHPATTVGTTGDTAPNPQPEPQPQPQPQPQPTTYAHEWYVANSGSDSNAGNTPTAPFKTISRGVLAAGPGDRINV